jgi:hypothetical protein
MALSNCSEIRFAMIFIMLIAQPSRSWCDMNKANAARATAQELVSAPGLPRCYVAASAEAHLARLPQTGSSVCSLYELEITFDQVLVNLGLASMATDEKERIHGELGIVMGRGLNDISGSRKLNSEGKLQSEDITASLKSIAHHLQAASRPLRGRETGLQQANHIVGREQSQRITGDESRNWRQCRRIFERFLQSIGHSFSRLSGRGDRSQINQGQEGSKDA